MRCISRSLTRSGSPSRAARVVAQDVSHRLRGNAEEMRAALDGEPLLVNDLEIHLIHQRRGVEGEVAMPPPALSVRQNAELLVDEPEQRIERLAVALLDRP